MVQSYFEKSHHDDTITLSRKYYTSSATDKIQPPIRALVPITDVIIIITFDTGCMYTIIFTDNYNFFQIPVKMSGNLKIT